MREELDIYTLQSEINNHLGMLGVEGGEKAQTAAFKGYALLKKISSLEKKDFVGKLDEEISQKLKVWRFVISCAYAIKIRQEVILQVPAVITLLS